MLEKSANHRHERHYRYLHQESAFLSRFVCDGNGDHGMTVTRVPHRDRHGRTQCIGDDAREDESRGSLKGRITKLWLALTLLQVSTRSSCPKNRSLQQQRRRPPPVDSTHGLRVRKGRRVLLSRYSRSPLEENQSRRPHYRRIKVRPARSRGPLCSARSRARSSKTSRSRRQRRAGYP